MTDEHSTTPPTELPLEVRKRPGRPPERARLRPATPDDEAAVAAVLADPTVARWWPVTDPAEIPTLCAGTDPELVVWLIELEGRVVGVIQAWEESDPMYRHAGIDLSLVADAQGRGLGPSAIRAVARWLFEVRGHHRLTIDPNAANENAIRAYRKVGFRPVGILRAYEWHAHEGRWTDGLLMDLLPEDLSGEHGG